MIKNVRGIFKLEKRRGEKGRMMRFFASWEEKRKQKSLANRFCFCFKFLVFTDSLYFFFGGCVCTRQVFLFEMLSELIKPGMIGGGTWDRGV